MKFYNSQAIDSIWNCNLLHSTQQEHYHKSSVTHTHKLWKALSDVVSSKQTHNSSPLQCCSEICFFRSLESEFLNCLSFITLFSSPNPPLLIFVESSSSSNLPQIFLTSSCSPHLMQDSTTLPRETEREGMRESVGGGRKACVVSSMR